MLCVRLYTVSISKRFSLSRGRRLLMWEMIIPATLVASLTIDQVLGSPGVDGAKGCDVRARA